MHKEEDMAETGVSAHRQGTVAKAAGIIEQIVAQELASECAQFVRILYNRTDVDDLEEYSPATLAAIAKSLWHLTERRHSGEITVRVFNPTPEQDCFDSPHTVLQVITDDTPFIIDSVMGELAAGKFRVQRILHPIIETQRDARGNRVDSHEVVETEQGSWAEDFTREKGFVRESIMHVEINRQDDPAVLEEIRRKVESVLGQVKTVVNDWHPMEQAVAEAVDELQRYTPPTVDREDLRETVAFLKWLLDSHFAFLGVRDYKMSGSVETGDLSAIESSGLGLLRDPNMRVLRKEAHDKVMTPRMRAFLQQPTAIIVTKANIRSRVHRRVHMDYVGIKRYDKQGRIIGERRLVGLFTASAYNRSPRDIPLLRQRIEQVIDLAHLPPNSHDLRSLANVLETYPRDELFQASAEELLETSLDLVRLQKRPHTKIFIRFDQFDRFASVMVYVPRNKYDTSLRIKIGRLLARTLDGRVASFTPYFLRDGLTRVHFIIAREAEELPQPDIPDLEQRIDTLMRDWQEDFYNDLLLQFGNREGLAWAERYAHSFPVAYRERFDFDRALADLMQIEKLPGSQALGLRSYRQPGDPDSALRLTIYHWDQTIPLSDLLVVMENMGLKVIEEVPYTLELPADSGTTQAGEVSGGRTVWLHDFFMANRSRQKIDLESVQHIFEDAVKAVWCGDSENDIFNRLTLEQGLGARDVVILRALARLLKQAGGTFSDSYIVTALSSANGIARMLTKLFALRFDPAGPASLDERLVSQEALLNEIKEALDQVDSLDADRIIRQYLTLIMAARRTNFYQSDVEGRSKSYLSIKFASREIEFLPQPRPLFEVFVYSPRVEGVHLRGGKVARGGLRWSDRPEDFRSEILGLVKAQFVKNSVIVPTGAKGGFVPKKLPGAGASREDIQNEAIASYKIFISALLDITDNQVADGIAPPENVVRYDDDDPYLVVAADKGTATFSDIANEVAQSYGFWLGDAFASGGRLGYDHKKMGITARGAWEAVKRHFREMGRDIQQTPFTVVGVGDMSGDVFGNGMLLSTQTRLIAAFDHRDIFIDPDPDPATSYAERKRLFELPRSSWQDYDQTKLSKGGGIFSRRQKSISLPPEAAEALGLPKKPLTPQELMTAILMAKADLLWFGGIGTYVKASTERNSEVSDRANDPIRINGGDVGAKVIGEGANLGITQCGRIEYARAGGRINSDFIDNAAGVDCSDHEVNIKIALDAEVEAGTLEGEQRNATLETMTENVAKLVLQNNYNQTLALTLAETASARDIDAHGRFIRALEQSGILSRSVEFLPDDETLRELKESGRGLTRPEIAVLLAYSKITLSDELCETDVPDDPYLGDDLIDYFPPLMRERFEGAIEEHRLRRNIIATVIANDLVNTGGLTFVNRIRESMGVSSSDITRSFIIARDVFKIGALRGWINALDGQVSAEAQHHAHEAIRVFMRSVAIWFLRYRPSDLTLAAAVERYDEPVNRLAAHLENCLSEYERELLNQRIEKNRAMGLGEDLAKGIALLEPLKSACDIIDIASEFDWTPEDAASAYFAIGEALKLDQLRAGAYNLTSGEHWERLAVRRSIEDLFRQQRVLTSEVIGHAITVHAQSRSGRDLVGVWLQDNEREVERVTSLIEGMEGTGPLSGAKLSLAGSQIRDLISGFGGRQPLDGVRLADME